MAVFVTLEGYIVRRTTEKAIALVKEGAGYQADLIWVPRSCCHDGETLEIGDVDISCMQHMAEDKGLDW
jgi:hypothetical protein